MSNPKRVSSLTGLEIAVIGMAGRFPGAENIAQFWENLKQGVESIAFFTEEELIQAGVDRNSIHNPNFVKAQGLITDPEYFDADFFGYTPAEAQRMDPQTRIFHECVWQALEDSGYYPGTYDGLIGLFAGAAANPVWEAANSLSSAGDSASVFGNSIVMQRDFLTTLISYKLNLKGPSMLIQTACSTSLVALHMACLNLLTRGCDLALAGGVTISFPQNRGYLYQEGLTVSPDGHCRAFDALAQGTVGGEGAGVVVLKRYEEALRDGDHIYAIVKGTGVNNDGAAKVGFTAPSVNGQAQMLKSIYHLAGVDPATVSYIETHGTGTALGDPVEIKALKSVFKTEKRNYCAIGSVKTNIGHLNAAAGIAGFVKTVLAIQHQQIPPSLYFQTPNPELDLMDSPFYVNRRLRDWSSHGEPLRAGVSSFGIGGTNAHAILEEAPANEKPSVGRNHQLLLLSAKTASALDMLTRNLIAYLESSPNVNLADLTYTLQVGRAHFPYRRTVLGSSFNETIAELKKPSITSVADSEQKTVVFIFPNQESQYVNMGFRLYQTENYFKDELDRCLTILQPMLPVDPQIILYPENNQPSGFSLSDPRVAFPLLFSFEYALAQLLIKWGVKPDLMLGDGIGEYVAARLSGVFSLEDALALLVLQGELLQTSTGTKGTVLAELERRLSETNFKQPELPYISNITGRWITVQEATSAQYWLKQLRESRRWADGLQVLLKNQQAVFIEVGPGENLSTLLSKDRTIDQKRPLVSLIRLPRENVADDYYLFQQLGLLWRAGLNINWKGLYQNQRRCLMSLPTYPFERQRYWIDEDPLAMLKNTVKTDSGLIKDNDLNNWLYLPNWTSSELLTVEIDNRDRRILLFVHDEPLVAFFTERARKELAHVILVKAGAHFTIAANNTYTINPGNQGDYQLLVDDLISRGEVPELIGHLWNVGGETGADFDLDAVKQKQDIGYYSLLYLTQALSNRSFAANIDLVVFTTDLHRITGAEELDPAKSTILGPCKVIPLEYINISARSIDVQLPEPGGKLENELVGDLITEFCSSGNNEPVVAYRGRNRWVQTVRRVTAELWEELAAKQVEIPKLLRKSGVYIITGGLGKMGLAFAGFLAETVGAKIVLIGRTEFPPREEWENWLTTHPLDDRISQKIIKIKGIEEKSPSVLVFGTDLANSTKLAEVFRTAEERLGKINGVIHAAGVTELDLIGQLTKEKCEKHFQAKIYGLLGLTRVIQGRELDFVTLTSTVATFSPALGHGTYATGNIFMDAFTQKYGRTLNCRWISIDWSGWDFATAGTSQGQIVKERGTEWFMNPAEGWQIWQRILNLPLVNQVIVSPSPLDFLGRLRSKDNRQPSAKNIDRNQRSKMKAAYAAPETYLERVLIDIWQEVLRHENIGVNDNFFDIGGNSLTLVQAHNLIKQRLQSELTRKITISTHFQYPTVGSFVQYLSGSNEAQAAEIKEENLAKAKKALQRTLSRRGGVKEQ